MITRAALHRVLLEYAEENGVPIGFNKRLVQVEDETGRPVAARFADGLTAEGDFLVGADGIGSQVRRSVMPEAPEPVYTGMMAPGGFSACLDPDVRPRSRQCVHFILGRNGFFGYFNTMTQDGPRTVWWSTAAAPLRPRIEMNESSREDLRRRLMALHGNWARPVPQLIESATDVLDIAIHDVPSLPRWSAGRVLLIGDAAHAVAPHSGQGASMALEDAMYLAKLFREANGGCLATVFTRFEAERRPRTDKVIALGRRNGRSKAGMPALAYWIQQQMIRIFVPLTLGRRQDWLLGYTIE